MLRAACGTGIRPCSASSGNSVACAGRIAHGGRTASEDDRRRGTLWKCAWREGATTSAGVTESLPAIGRLLISFGSEDVWCWRAGGSDDGHGGGWAERSSR